MGGGQYSFDVAREARASRPAAQTFDYSGYATDTRGATQRREVHPLLNVKGKTRECMNDQAIVVALDVTRSRGDDAKVVYRKLPTFIGWLELQGYLPGAAIGFAAIGDADSDQAPLQVSQWERDNRLDEALSKLWLEEGGGGTGQESYELAAWFYANRTKLKINAQGRKGYFFFVGDEGFYPQVKAGQVQKCLGQQIPRDLPSQEVFRALEEKFHVFLIFPKKSWQERQADIDAEIAQRVRSAGGLYDEVDVRVSLIWNTRDDLDLHVITPGGEEIYYGYKKARCGGELDVDRNVRGETTKPVENVRWRKGEGSPGEYKVIIQTYAFHEQKPRPIEYKLEVDVAGKITHYEGVMSPKYETGRQSNQQVCTFRFAKGQQPAAKGEEDLYANYDERLILKQWQTVLPEDHILLLDDPEDIIEVMVGVIGLMEQRTDLEGYMAALEGGVETVAQDRRSRIARAIGDLAQAALPTVGFSLADLPGGA